MRKGGIEEEVGIEEEGALKKRGALRMGVTEQGDREERNTGREWSRIFLSRKSQLAL